MKIRDVTLAMFFSILAAAVMAANAAPLKSPDKVKEALRVLAYVQADMASKLPNKAYNRLPHENEEFQEAAPALLDAVSQQRSELLHLSTRQASLEDVFVNLTGRHLREA